MSKSIRINGHKSKVDGPAVIWARVVVKEIKINVDIYNVDNIPPTLTRSNNWRINKRHHKERKVVFLLSRWVVLHCTSLHLTSRPLPTLGTPSPQPTPV